jgi:hypothetical protein
MGLLVQKVQTNGCAGTFRRLLKKQQSNGNTAACLPAAP